MVHVYQAKANTNKIVMYIVHFVLHIFIYYQCTIDLKTKSMQGVKGFLPFAYIRIGKNVSHEWSVYLCVSVSHFSFKT